MKKVHLKKISILIFVTFLIVAQVFSPVLVERAYAQNANAGIGIASGIIGTAASCIFPGGLSGAVTDLASSIFTSKETKLQQKKEKEKRENEEKIKKEAEEAKQKALEAELKLTTVPTLDGGSIGRATIAQEVLRAKAEQQRKEEEEIRIKAEQEYKKTHCLDTIVHLITTKVIDKITLSTVDWINNGFKNSDGGDDPLWLENPGTFFENIAKEEINSVTGWYTKDPDKYPFGVTVMSTILGQVQARTSQNLQFSLNQVLAHGDYAAFKEDFSIGGWAGYTAFLEPQNNPFGNQLLINAELGNRIRGTSINKSLDVSRQLAMSGGVLSPRECVLTATGNPNDAYLGGGSGYSSPSPLFLGESYSTVSTYAELDELTLPVAVQSEIDDFTNEQDAVNAYNSIVLRSRCAKWNQTTPGSLVANQLTTNINLQTNKLVSADSLNENLGLIFDALLNQLVEQGLKSLQSAENGGDNSNNVLLAQVNNQNPGSSGITYPNGQSADSQPTTYQILSPNGVPNQSLYNIQLQYIALASTSPNNALAIIDQLIPKIRALDYCVPGPNPRWIPSAEYDLEQMLLGVEPADPSDTPAQRQAYYAGVVNTLTGASIAPSVGIDSYFQLNQFMQNVLTKYQEKMLQSYSLSNFPPTMRAILPGLFDEIDTLEADRETITEYLTNIPGPLNVLQQILSSLSSIAANSPGGILDENDPNVQAQFQIFDSISDSLVSQSQLNQLTSSISQWQAKITLVDSNVSACIAETGPTYTYPNKRKAYIFPYFNYIGLQTVPDNTFLPGINFGTGPNDINIEWNGVTITAPSSGLQLFENVIQSVH